MITKADSIYSEIKERCGREIADQYMFEYAEHLADMKKENDLFDRHISEEKRNEH